MRSTATIATENARRYMIQLCKHFGHRVTATFNDKEGRIAFETGEVHLRAAPRTLMLLADAAQPDLLERLETVIDSHLKRFAFREPDLAVEWRRAPAEA